MSIKTIDIVIDRAGHILQQTIEFNPHQTIYAHLKITLRLQLTNRQPQPLIEQSITVPRKYRKSLSANQKYIDTLIQKLIHETLSK